MICPIMTKGLLSNRDCDFENKENYLIPCEKKKCGLWDDKKIDVV